MSILKKAIIAARVSSDPQAKYGYSIPTQLQAMRQYAAARDYEVLCEIQDDCSGTIPIRERPGGARIYELIEQRAADALIFYTLDRATRDEDLIEIAVLRRDLRLAGMELHFCDSGQSDLSTLGGVVDNIKAALASEERKQIIERTTRGRKAKAAAGRWVGSGPAPLGYRRVGVGKDVQLEVNLSEVELVRRIFGLYTGTDCQAPLALIRIANLFNAEGVPVSAKSRNGGGWGPGRGWYPLTIKKILNRRIYIGEYEYAGQIAIVPELAIVDRHIFNQVQERARCNQENAQRNRRYEYLMVGRMECSCGARMNGKSAHGGKHKYYRCNQQKVKSLHLCSESYLIGREVDAKVWDWIVSLLSDEEKLLHGLKRKEERDEADNIPRRSRLTAIDEEIRIAERKMKRFMADYGDLDEDDPALPIMKAEMRNASKRLAVCKSEHNRVQAEIDEIEFSDYQRHDLLVQAAKLRDGMLDSDFETKRYFLDRLSVFCKLKHVTDNQRKLTVTCSITMEPESIPLTTSQTDCKENRAPPAPDP